MSDRSNDPRAAEAREAPVPAAAESATTPPGVDDRGILRDPETYFRWLVRADSRRQYKTVLERIGPELYRYGLGQQIDQSGEHRARLFMPHAGNRNVAPRNEAERRLGVKQEPSAWVSQVDVAESQGDDWTWITRGPAYVPYEPEDGNGNGNGGVDEEEFRAEVLTHLTAIEMLLQETIQAWMELTRRIEELARDGVKVRFR